MIEAKTLRASRVDDEGWLRGLKSQRLRNQPLPKDSLVTTSGQTMDNDAWCREFERVRPAYQQFTGRLSGLLSTLLESHSIKAHTIEHRTKDVESFRAKLSKPGRLYDRPLEEITDLSGIRVILYYTEDLDRVSDLVQREFAVDSERSSDRRASLQPNELGYLSVHHVLKLNSARSDLTEWAPFKSYIAEIQLRTVLQHAWAAISHALHYKHEAEVPREMTRRLFRLSGLLELADQEFSVLREQKADVIERVRQVSLPAEAKALPLDSVGLTDYLVRDTRPATLMKQALAIGFTDSTRLTDEGEPSDQVSDLVRICQRARLSNVLDLTNALDQTLPLSEDFLKEVYGRSEGNWAVSPGFLVLLHVVLARSERFDVPFLVEMGFSKGIAKRVVSVAKALGARIQGTAATSKAKHPKL
jgi:putative GTP pyrophosphokinase